MNSNKCEDQGKLPRRHSQDFTTLIFNNFRFNVAISRVVITLIIT